MKKDYPLLVRRFRDGHDDGGVGSLSDFYHLKKGFEMDAMEKKHIVITMVTTDELSLHELASLNYVVSADLDPHDRMFDYETVKPLFTEQNGTRCHQSIKDSIAYAFMDRKKSDIPG